VALLSACGKKDEAQVAAAPAPALASAPAAAPSLAGQHNFGGVTKVSREVEAVGSTQELAVLAALQMAVSQVNGVRVASQMQSVRAGLHVSVNGQAAGSARSEAFAQKVIGASHGAVTGFEILARQEIDKVDEEAVSRVRASDGGYSYSASASSDRSVDVRASGQASAQTDGASAQGSRSFTGSATSSDKAKVDVSRGPSSYESDATYKKMRSYWKVRVKVDVAQYRAPDEQGRPKIVVAMPRTLVAKYPVGDANVASAEVAQAVRGRLSDILTQTKRFIVLDRELSKEMQAEIDHINSGNVRVQDSARLGQQLATDLILVPTVERFEYPRLVQKLRMSDRELVSYSGGGRITLRLVNAATGEVVLSDSFEHKLASADPSTMPEVVDGKSMAAGMMDSLAGQIGNAVLTEVFPVTVISLTGDQAVLSQGGESVRAGQRWLAVALGEELKDPQTGRSLGRHETAVGLLRIDRVSSMTSYGTFEDGAPNLSGQPFKAGGIVLKQVAESKPEKTVQADKVAAVQPAPAARPAVRAQKEGAETEAAAPKDRAPRKAEDKGW
jgi:curli biogenesis system outer membrane secretion channel CsgG